MTARGIRNNNPGNIAFNPRNAWQGQLGLEVGVAKPRFARFDQAENGIRALGKLLLNYRGKAGLASTPRWSLSAAGLQPARTTPWPTHRPSPSG